MINVNEIRIGNILEWNKQQFNVCRIFSQNEGVENENWTKPCSELHPIPLTEEWLVKMGGFKGQYVWHFDGMSLDQLSKSKEYFLSINDGEYIEGIAIKHIHQLQNLYFALTGEELKINLVD